jgi:hypothetical protein
MNEMKSLLHCVEFDSIWRATFCDIAPSNYGISGSFPRWPKRAA